MAAWLAAALALAAAEPRVRVCTQRACRKADSAHTLRLLLALASTAPLDRSCRAPGVSAAALQRMSAEENVQPCGCLGGCGSGPNVAIVGASQIFHGVCEPVTALALLQEVADIQAPDAAAKAYAKKIRADQAIRANQVNDHHVADKGLDHVVTLPSPLPQHEMALALLTAALNEAGTLGSQAAFLLCELLEQRANLYDDLGKYDKAASDRRSAARMLSLPSEELVA